MAGQAQGCCFEANATADVAEAGRPLTRGSRQSPGGGQTALSPLRGLASPAMAETPVQARPGEALVWTDGACRRNPGPGGWAAIVVPPGGGEAVELAGSAAHTTNNRMEFTAAIEGLRRLPAGSHACVVTDSLLLLKSMTLWVAGGSGAAGGRRAALRSRTAT